MNQLDAPPGSANDGAVRELCISRDHRRVISRSFACVHQKTDGDLIGLRIRDGHDVNLRFEKTIASHLLLDALPSSYERCFLKRRSEVQLSIANNNPPTWRITDLALGAYMTNEATRTRDEGDNH